jgi:hypothetical protein
MIKFDVKVDKHLGIEGVTNVGFLQRGVIRT